MLNCMIAVVLLPQFTGELQLSSNLLNQFTIILDFSELDKFIEFDFRPNKLENLTQFCLRYQVKIPGMQFTFRILPYIQDACEIQFTVQKMKKLNTSLIVYDQNDLKIQQIDIQFSVLSTLSSEFALSMFLGFSFIVIIFVCRFFSRRQEERTVALILLRMLEFQRRVPQLEVKIRQQVIQDEPVFHYKEFYLINPPSLNIQQSQLQFEKQSFMYKENKYDLFILNVNAQNVFEIMEISCEIKTLVGYCVISEQTKRSSGVRYVTIDQLDNFLLDDDKCSKYYLLLLFQYQSDISFDELLQNSIQLIQQFDLQTFMMDDFYAQQHLISKSKNLDKLLQKLESELNQQEEVIDMQPIKTLNVNLENNAATPVDLWELVQKDLRQQKIQNLDNQSIIPEFYYKQAQNDIASVYSDQYNSCGNDIVSVQSFVSDTFNSYREIIHHVNYPLTTFTTQPQFESQLNSQVYNIIEPQFTVPDITPKITNFEESSLQINTKNQQQNICDPPIVPYLNTTNNDVCDYEDTPELTSAVIHNISEDLSGNDYQQQLVSYYNQFLENIQSNENITESSQYTNYFPPLNTEAVSENVSICEIPISVQNPGNDMFTAPTNIMTQNPGNDMFTAPTNIMTQNPGNDMFTAPTNIMTQNPGNDMFTAPTNIMTQNPGNDMFTAPTNIMTQNPGNDMFTAPTNIMTQNPGNDMFTAPTNIMTQNPGNDMFTAPTNIMTQNPGNDMFTAPTNIMTQNPGNDMFTAPTNIMTQNPGNDMFTAPTNIMTQNPGNDMFTAPTNIMTQNPGNDMFTAPTNIMTQNPSNDMFTAPTNIMTQNPETEVYSTLKDQNQPFSRISFTNFESGLISPQDIQLNSEAGKLDVFTDSSSQSSNIIQPNNINKKIVIQKSFSAKSSLQLTQGYRYIDDDFSTLQDQGKITDVSQLNPKAFFNIIIQKLNKNKLQDIQEESQGLLNLLEYPSLPQVDSQQDRTYNLFSTPKNALDPIMQLQYSSLVNLFDQLPQNLASIMIIGGPIFRLKLACIAVLKYKSSAYYLDFRAICTANISFLVDEEKIKYKLNVVENIYQSLIPYQKAAVYTQSQMSYQRQKIISACIGIASYVYLRDISDKVLTLQCLMDICINNPDDNISSIIIQLASQNTWELFLYAVKHILINY
ncbi:hypothetical protein SS50377_25334 [Spironucleus salmonicida]|uniref:Uncharacterized protein n=1 Tax=Spironucleus salmonicida TaxID=348837 RepID=A0A9P8RXP5_9EUKA|nr:hypothetical protein SS50377_25334 [Spironucleus salmonicida]